MGKFHGSFLAIGLISFSVSTTTSCRRSRPPGVPDSAAFVKEAWGGDWQQCRPQPGPLPVRCRIWNEKGLPMFDEAFQPCDGGSPPNQDDLQIDIAPKCCAGPDRIFLTNGRILLPHSRFQKLKKFMQGLGFCREPVSRDRLIVPPAHQAGGAPASHK